MDTHTHLGGWTFRKQALDELIAGARAEITTLAVIDSRTPPGNGRWALFGNLTPTMRRCAAADWCRVDVLDNGYVWARITEAGIEHLHRFGVRDEEGED